MTRINHEILKNVFGTLLKVFHLTLLHQEQYLPTIIYYKIFLSPGKQTF